MTCPDDPAAVRRMLSPPNHLEPQHVEVKESEIGRLKRKLALVQKELSAWRTTFPDYKYHPHIDGFTYNGVEMFDG